jgi:hypothetical protein
MDRKTHQEKIEAFRDAGRAGHLFFFHSDIQGILRGVVYYRKRLAAAAAGIPESGSASQGGSQSHYLRERIREAVDADNAFILQVCEGDAVRYEAMNKMPSRVVLTVCEAYLRRVAAQVAASKKKPKGHG